MPKISVIIPVYNVEKYLPECIDSILNQTFQDFEIICVDDGSTDRSLDILQDYRLKEAKKMILENQYKISEIAEKVGYHDISYFIRVFKKKYGVTPNNYGKY